MTSSDSSLDEKMTGVMQLT